MEQFATPVPCIYSDGDQEQSRGQLGIYTALTFKRFQQLMTQKTGVPAAQLSAVLAYKRSANGEEKRQKLNINESTNFGIVMRIHAKEIDAHFLISLKRSKRDRKGSSWRKAADVEEENDVIGSDVTGAVDPSEALKAVGKRHEAEWKEADRNEDDRNEFERHVAQRHEAKRHEVERSEAQGNEAQRKEVEREESERNKVGREEAERENTEWEKQRERNRVQEGRFGISAENGTAHQSETERKTAPERQFPQIKNGHDEPQSPVSTLPADPGFFPPSPVSPEQEFPDLLKKPQTRSPVIAATPRETSPTVQSQILRKAEPILTGSVKSFSESGRLSVHERAGLNPKAFSDFKPVKILQRPSAPPVSTSNEGAGDRMPQASTAPGRRPPGFSTSEPSFSGRQKFPTPGATLEALRATEDPGFRLDGRLGSFPRGSQVPLQGPQQERETFLRPGQGPRFANGAPSTTALFDTRPGPPHPNGPGSQIVLDSSAPPTSGRFQQVSTPVYSDARFPVPSDASVHPTGGFSHPGSFSHPGNAPGQQFGSPDRGRIASRHVGNPVAFDTRPGPPHPNAPGSQAVSASVFASAVSAASEALAPGRHPNAREQIARHVAGRETGHVASGGSSDGVHGPTRQLTPFEMAGLHGVLRDLAAASGRREGFGGFAKTCKFCAFCVESQRGPTPFHWCVDDRVVSGFRGPSPAGPIERPGKRVEAAA